MYGLDPVLIVGVEIAESEDFLVTLLACQNELAEEANKARG